MYGKILPVKSFISLWMKTHAWEFNAHKFGSLPYVLTFYHWLGATCYYNRAMNTTVYSLNNLIIIITDIAQGSIRVCHSLSLHNCKKETNKGPLKPISIDWVCAALFYMIFDLPLGCWLIAVNLRGKQHENI